MEQARRDYLLTRFWISAKGFWSANGGKLAWVFSFGLIAMIITNVGFQYAINVWYRAIFDAIEKGDSATVFYLAGAKDYRTTAIASSQSCCLKYQPR